jgi:hypothetical protein
MTIIGLIRYSLYFRGTIYRAPKKGRHMGLPLPEIVIYRYITWEMPNNSAFFKQSNLKTGGFS